MNRNPNYLELAAHITAHCLRKIGELAITAPAPEAPPARITHYQTAQELPYEAV